MMRLHRPTWIYRLALLAIILMCAGLALRIDWTRAFSTDVFDLLSHDKRIPASSQKVQSILQSQLSREILIAVEFGQTQPNANLKSGLFDQIRSMPSFQSVASVTDTPISDQTAGYVFQQRIPLLFPKWLSEHSTGEPVSDWDEAFIQDLANRAAEELDLFLSNPESMAFEALLPSDPLLLIPGLQQRFGSAAAMPSDRSAWVFTAQLRAAPSSHEVQQQLQEDLSGLQTWVYDNLGEDVVVRDTGFHRFAAESEAGIRTEIFRLNLLSLGLTLLITLLFLRKPWLLIPVVLVVLASVGCALTLTLSLLGQVHIIALVIGSILAGVAIDYCFHILLKREELQADSFSETLRSIRLPLIASCVSTVFGFLVLLGNPVSAIQQVGVFVSFGLGFALLLSSLTALAFDFQGRVNWSRNLNYPLPFLYNRWVKRVGVWFALAGGVLFLLHHENRDNIEDLQITLTDAPANDNKVRSLLGESSHSTYWITLGDSLQEVIDHQLQLRESILVQAHSPEVSFQQIATLLPSTAEIQLYLSFKKKWGNLWTSALHNSLETHGFEASAFEAFGDDWKLAANTLHAASDWESRVSGLVSQLQYPLSLMIHGNPVDGYWGTTRVRNADVDATRVPVQSFELAPLKVLNQAFSGYRAGVTRSLWGSVAVILLALLVVFRPKGTWKIVQIPAMAVLTTLGIFVLAGEAITFFHLIGLLLGSCITLDYAVFSVQQKTHPSEPISIRASALTTMASFAALSLSHIPAVSDLGTTVFTIALMGLFHTECSLRQKP